MFSFSPTAALLLYSGLGTLITGGRLPPLCITAVQVTACLRTTGDVSTQGQKGKQHRPVGTAVTATTGTLLSDKSVLPK